MDFWQHSFVFWCLLALKPTPSFSAQAVRHKPGKLQKTIRTTKMEGNILHYQQHIYHRGHCTYNTGLYWKCACEYVLVLCLGQYNNVFNLNILLFKATEGGTRNLGEASMLHRWSIGLSIPLYVFHVVLIKCHICCARFYSHPDVYKDRGPVQPSNQADEERTFFGAGRRSSRWPTSLLLPLSC